MSVKRGLGVGVFISFSFFLFLFLFVCLFLSLTSVDFLVFFNFFLLCEYLALTFFTSNRLNTTIILMTSLSFYPRTEPKQCNFTGTSITFAWRVYRD